MPTVVVSKIGTNYPTGRDYPTCKAWADAAPADLVASDTQWIGECYNDGTISETVPFNMDSTSDATRNMILRCATGHSFKDHVSKTTNELRPNQANGVLITFSGGLMNDTCIQVNPFARVQGLQISNASPYVICNGNGTNTVADMGRFENCLMRASAVTAGRATSNKRVSYINCALIVEPANQYGIDDEGSVAGRISSCTIVCVAGTPTAKGINTGGDVYNTATFGWGVDNTIGAGTNNATNRSSFGGGSTNQVSLTTTNEIYSVTATTEDLRVKSTATGLAAHGADETAWTGDLDIVGQARHASTPTIGAWEIAAAPTLTKKWQIPTIEADGTSRRLYVWSDTALSTVVVSNQVVTASGGFFKFTDPTLTVGFVRPAVLIGFGADQFSDASGGPGWATGIEE